MKTIATLTAVGKTNGHCTTTAFHTTNMPMHHIRLPQHISACSMDTTHTHTLRRSTELTTVQINKSWNGQQVENMTSIPFLLALHCYKVCTKHAHAPHSSERARRCVFSGLGHHSYIQLMLVQRTNNCSEQQILERATGIKYDKQPDSCLHFTATKCGPTTPTQHFQVNVHAGARSMYTTHTYNSYQCIPTPL
jgi:hypothetical protein